MIDLLHLYKLGTIFFAILISKGLVKAMSRTQFNSWNDAHYCGLRSQSNVYSLSKLALKDNNVKILAGSIDGHLASVQFAYQPSCDKLVAITKGDVIFDSVLDANNPESEGETELVSMDVVCNWDGQERNVLAVSYLKLGHYDEDKAPEAFMNIYELCETKDSSLGVSKSLLQHLSLDFIPFKLNHHSIPIGNRDWKICLLLSGNDHKIHVYQPIGNGEGYQEVDTTKHFPELCRIEDCVTQLEMKQLDNRYRVTSYGTQNGVIHYFLVNTESIEILESGTSEMDSPITSLHFFYQHSNVKRPEFLKRQDVKVKATIVIPGDNDRCRDADGHSYAGDEEGNSEEEALNLLATSALDPSVVYHDVMANGLTKSRSLPISNTQDVVLCSCVMDVDFDGENEVLLGTYGKLLLVYKLCYEKPQVYSSTPFHSPMPVPIHTDTPILSFEGDKKDTKDLTADKQDKDSRRRHKTVAATISDNEAYSLLDKPDKHKSEECGMISGGTSQQALVSRLFRSQENLATPSPRSTHNDTPDRTMTPDLTIPHFAMAPVTDYPCYKLIWTRCFCNPVMGLACDDVMGDGMLDMVVLTLKGLHILQPDLEAVATLVFNRLQQICDSQTEAEKHSQIEMEYPHKEANANDHYEQHG